MIEGCRCSLQPEGSGRKLAIGPAQFGLVVSSYTLAAGLAGFVASSLVDRTGRKAAFLGLDAGFLLAADAPEIEALGAIAGARLFGP